MRKHLTDVSIAKMRLPKEGQTETFDAGYPGLCIRVGCGGSKSFVIFHRRDGVLKRTTLGRWPRVSLADAHNAWRRVAEGHAPTVEQESTGELFAKIAEQWLRLDCAPRHKESSLKVTARIVDHDVLPTFGQKQFDKITRKDIAALIDGVVIRAPVKARGVHAVLHRLFRWSVGRGILMSNPMEGMETPGKSSSRERVLSDDELSRVWRACESEGVYGAAARLLILTGCRREEITQLRWSEINGDCIELSNGRSKNGQAHRVSLSAPARELIASLPRIADTGYVFTVNGIKPVGSWSRAKARLDRQSGVSNWVVHDLRRTMATGLQKLGISLQVVKSCLGHTSGSRAGIVGVYQKHNYADEKRAALEAWGEHVVKLTR